MLSVAPVTTTAKFTPSETTNIRQNTGPSSTDRAEGAAEARTAALRPLAVDPPKRGAAPQRLRDQEREETSAKQSKPTGPRPAFDETFLQRQAREALDPQEQRRAYEQARLSETPDPKVDIRG